MIEVIAIDSSVSPWIVADEYGRRYRVRPDDISLSYSGLWVYPEKLTPIEQPRELIEIAPGRHKLS